MAQSDAGGSRGPLGFPKHRRVRKRREYLGVQRHGRKVHLGHLLVLVAPRDGLSRLGVTVSRRVGNAVQRNRVKRLLREVWRQHRTQLPEGLDMVFIARRGASAGTFSGFLEEVRELARRLSHGAR